MNKSIFALALIALVASSAFAQDAAAPAPAVSDEGSTLYQVVSSTPELSFLTKAIDLIGATSALNTTGLQVTLFAPTDAAFETFLADSNLTLSQVLEDSTIVDALLQYHAVPALVPSSVLTDGLVLPTLLEGQDLTITTDGTTVTVNGAQSSATVVTPDLAASAGGLVHIIDAVLIPALT